MKYLTIRLLFFYLLFFSNCSRSDSETKESSESLGNGVPATEVKVIPASVKSFEYFVSASGKIASSAEVKMQFRRVGIIEKIFVSNGQNVKRGQMLAVLSNETQKLGFAKAKLLLQEKELAYNDQMMYHLGIKDTVRHSNVKTNIRISSGLATAEIAYQEAKHEYENSFLRAQISGVVSGVEINEGSPVNQGDLFSFIHDPVNMLVQAEVLEADAMLLTKQTLADIRPVASTDEVYRARVESINPRVDDKTGLVKVVLRLLEKSRLFPGMNVQATMYLPYDKNIIVPKEAIIIRSGKSVVFTVTQGRAKWNYVSVGRENGKDIEIIDGLNEGDQVIVTNNLQLAHDASVTIIN